MPVGFIVSFPISCCQVVSALVEELTSRNALGAALSGRDASSLLPLVGHLAKHIADPRHTQTLCALSHRLLDAYALPPPVDVGEGAEASQALVDVLAVLQAHVKGEVKAQDDLTSIKGMLDIALAGGGL